jgi:transglutaminase-like putative cysteine protease
MGTSVVRAAEALPTGASLAWTSTDPVVVKARGLVEAGSFSQAEGLLAGADKAVSPQARQARDEMVETIRRIRVEFSQAPDKLLASLQKSIPDATMADIDRWRADGDVRFREIDGKVCYFRREPSSLLRFSKEAKKRRDEHAAKAGKTDSNEAIADQKLVEHIQRVIAAAKQAGKAEVVPVRHHVNYTLTVHPDRPGAKAGSIVRCWLPFPQEYRQQKDVTLIRTSHPQRVVADNAMKGDMLSGPRQRTVYMEQKIEEPAKPVTFEEEFEYLSYAYCPDLKDEDAKPLAAGAISDEYLAERPPHIVFTPEVRAIVERVVGDEKNPLVKARRIFRYVCENMKWCPEVEYAIIPNLSDKGIKAKRGDCGVHAMMFITLCRAAGIPARWQTGWESKPGDSNMHDWAEFYVEPWGWLPCDTSYGFQKSDDPQIREFYFGHQDSYRMIVNLDYGWPLVPPKPSLRSEPADFQRGEVEIDGRNLYFEEWSYEMNFSLKDEAAGQ